MSGEEKTEDANKILEEIARQVVRLRSRPSNLPGLDAQQALTTTHLAQDLFHFATMSTSPIGGSGGRPGAGSPMVTPGGGAITPTTVNVNCPNCSYNLTVKLS
jgi:hypothetical protein